MSNFIHLLHRAGQAADQMLNDELRDIGLTPRQAVILVIAKELEPATQAELIDASGVDRSTAGDIVIRLANKGYINRAPNQRDRRAVNVTLTRKGEKVSRRVTACYNKCSEEILGAIKPAADRSRFVNALQSIAQTFGPIRSAIVRPKISASNDSATPAKGPPNGTSAAARTHQA